MENYLGSLGLSICAFGILLSGCTEPSPDSVRAVTQAVNSSPAGCVAGVCQVTAQISAGSHLSQFGVVSAEQIQLHNGALITRPNGAPASVISSHSGGIHIGGHAEVGAAISAHDIQVDAGATVHAFASAAGNIQLQEDAIVVGNTLSNAPLFTRDVSIVPSFSMPTTFASSVHLEPEAEESIDPGAFSSLTVKSRAKLGLSAGTYFVGTLNLEPQGILEFANAEGAIQVHVLDQLNCKGSWLPESASANVRLIYWGTSSTVIECDLSLTALVAPNASVRIADRHEVGQVVAKRVELGAGAIATATTFQSLTTGPGGKLLRDLTDQERIASCEMVQQFMGQNGRELECRGRGKNAVMEGQPVDDSAAQSICSAKYDECMNVDPCAAPPEVPASCELTLGERDTCLGDYLPGYFAGNVDLPVCATITNFEAYSYQPGRIPFPESCNKLRACWHEP